MRRTVSENNLLAQKNAEIGTEFDKYAFEHPEILADIPNGASLIFLPENDEELCCYNKKIARMLQKNGEEFIFIKIQKFQLVSKSRIMGISFASPKLQKSRLISVNR